MSNYIDSYYIDPQNGNDNNSGTVNSPFKTIQQGINVAEDNDNDGNKINLKGGTYYLDRPLVIYDGGEANAPLKIKSQSGAKAILDGSQIPWGGSAIEIKDASRIDLTGLEIRNAPGHGIEVINGQNINLNNNLIHHTQGMGIRVRGYMAENPQYEGNTYVQSSNVTIERNGVFQTNLSNSGSNKGVNNWGSAIQAWNANNIKITNNTVGENYGEGIALAVVDNGVVKNNLVYSNFSVQVYLDNVTDSRVEANFIHNNGDREFYRDNYPAQGIALANEIYNIADPARFYLNNNQIKRNVIVGANTGIVYGTWAGNHFTGAENSWKGLKNTTISHNTIYDSEIQSIKLDGDSNNSNIDIFKNIFAQESGGDLSLVDNLTGINFRRNMWFGGEAGDGASSTDINQNPSFVNPGGYKVSDYRLRQNSSAIDAVNSGTNDGWVTDGQADLGALEFGRSAFVAGDV